MRQNTTYTSAKKKNTSLGQNFIITSQQPVIEKSARNAESILNSLLRFFIDLVFILKTVNNKMFFLFLNSTANNVFKTAQKLNNHCMIISL